LKGTIRGARKVKRSKIAGMLLIASVTFLIFMPAGLAWSDNGVAVCTALDTQDNYSICADGQGGSFIAWVDTRNGTEEVFMQRLGSQGNVLWATNGINVSRGGSPDYNVKMVKAIDDGVIIAWTRGGGTGANIYAQKMSNTGATYWATAGELVCTATANQDLACLCSDGAGGAIIAWRDRRNGNYDIYAQRMNASGAANWTINGIPVCANATDQLDPVICSDGAGGAIIAWDDSRGSDDVFAQRVNPSGSVQWAAGGVPVSNIPASSQKDPLMCSDGAGGAILTWSDLRSDGDGDVYTQRLLPSGSSAWLANGTPVCVLLGAQQEIAIAASEAGGAFIGWVDNRDPLNCVTYIQRISGSGVVQWSANGIPVSNSLHDSYNVKVCRDGLGGAFITWTDDPGAGPIYCNINAQRVGPTGTTEWETNGKCVCNATDNQYLPAIDCVASGKAVIVWRDLRSGTDWDIYAQQIAITTTTQDDGLLTITIVVVVIIAAAVAVLLIFLYKKGKLKLPGRPAPSK
jgi:hypothetical protein